MPQRDSACFSVPKFGLSCLLENMASERYARSLDAAVHVQTFTDQSINFFLQAAGFEKIATWQFGQDALELKDSFNPQKAMMNSQDLSMKRWNPVLMTCNQFLIERVFAIKSTLLLEAWPKVKFQKHFTLSPNTLKISQKSDTA